VGEQNDSRPQKIFSLSANPNAAMWPLSWRGQSSTIHLLGEPHEDPTETGLTGRFDRRNPGPARSGPRHHHSAGQVRTQRHGEMQCQVHAKMSREKAHCQKGRQVRGQQVRTQMWSQVRAEMRPEVRTQELNIMKKVPPRSPMPNAALAAAGRGLLETYAGLAERGEHLLGRLLAGQAPRQWAHYPEDDAIDQSSGYQWFYHSHSPEDRPGATEHGHVHLFARKPLWGRRRFCRVVEPSTDFSCRA